MGSGKKKEIEYPKASRYSESHGNGLLKDIHGCICYFCHFRLIKATS